MPNSTLPSRGFSLVEVLIAIAIIAVSSALVIPNLRKFNTDQDLNTTSSEIVRMLKVAQSSAANNIKCDTSPTIPAGQFDVVINGPGLTYQLNPSCNSLAGTIPSGYSLSSETPTCTNKFIYKITFQNSTIKLACADVVPAYNDILEQELIINIKKNNVIQKKIYINTAGAIYEYAN